MATALWKAEALVSRGALARNVDVLRRAVGPAVQLWPAVKANAYGHGAHIVAKHLVERLDCRTLCVAHAAEAIELLQEGLEPDALLLLAGTLPDEVPFLRRWAHVVEPVCSGPEVVEALAAAAKADRTQFRIHLKVDTGMSRQGALPSAFGSLWQLCQSHAPHVQVRGVMSHFARADDDEATSRQQLELFKQATERLPPTVIRHMANSAAIFRYPQSHFQAARPGISLYGLNPGIEHEMCAQLQPVLTLRARATLCKVVPRGTRVSYGHLFETTRHSTLLVTIPLGYGDGIPRSQTQKMWVVIKGVKCPQDQLLVDASDVPGGVAVGTAATVIGDGLTADALAAAIGTINYEVTTALNGKRIHRRAVD